MQTNNDISNPVKNMLEDFNFGIFLHVINKNLIWVIVFVVVTSVIAHVYLRYTPRIFESVSTLMLKTQKTTQVLGVSELLRDDEQEINREIQLLKSKLIIGRALRTLPLDIGYYRQGRSRFFNAELYKASPISVKATVKDPLIYSIPVYFNILNKREYQISYTINGLTVKEKRRFEEEIESPFFKMTASLVRQDNLNELTGSDLFIRFNDHNSLVNEIASRVEVQPLIYNTKTVKILLNDPNKLKANDIVDAITREFVAYDKERKAESIHNVLGFLNQQIDTFGQQFYEFQDTVKYFRLQSGFVAPEQQIQIMVDKLDELERKKNQTIFDSNLMNWLYDYIDSKRNLNLLSIEDLSSGSADLKPQIDELNGLKGRRDQLLLDVTEDHPEVKLIDGKLNTILGRIKLDLEDIIQKNKYKLDLINKEYDAYLGDLITLPDKESEFSRLMRQSKLQEEFYLGLVEKRSQYLIARAGIVSDYIILQEAVASRDPVTPDYVMIRMMGVGSGLFLGIFLIIGRYLTHRNIVSMQEVEQHTNAAILGVVPKYKIKLERSKIIVTQNPKSLISEAFRSIRANLQFLPAKGETKTVAVTSTISGEGKTFVALNLAAIYSLMDKKVIVLDFDMRKPRLDKIFGVDTQIGMSTILIGKSSVEECIYQSEIKNLDFITSGPVPPNPSELIMLPKTKEVIEYLKKKYDYIVFDTPPVGLVTDGLELLKTADYPIYVLRADYSKREFIQNINRIIESNKVQNLSVILNDFGRGASGKAYSSGYGYGYGYGFGYNFGGYYSDEPEEKESFLKRFFGNN